MNFYAPIFIPTLCRVDHFKRCVESLACCTHADKTELFIALDYPLSDSHWDGYKKIQAYIPSITGFASVNVIKRSENYGTVKNYLETQKELFARYDALIFSEDDNEFSPNFLDYMNKGLEKFRDDKKVYAICGYNFPVEMPKEYPYNHYFWKGFSAWGYGMWKDRFERYNANFSLDYVRQYLLKINQAYDLTKVADHYLRAMLRMYHIKKLSGDMILSSMLVKDQAYCVFPTTSLVKNYGHDGSGVGCGPIVGHDPYLAQDTDVNLSFVYDNIAFHNHPLVDEILRKHFRTKLKSKIKLFMQYVFFLIQSKDK